MDKEKYEKLPIFEGKFFFKEKYFWEKWLSRGQRKLVFKSLSKKRSQQEVTKAMYRRIIMRFLGIYFYELFYLDRATYFLLGGRAIRCRISKFPIFETAMVNESVSFSWYHRPLYMYGKLIQIKFMRGTSRIIQIKKEFLKNNNLYDLPLKKDLQQQQIEKGIFITEKKLEP